MNFVTGTKILSVRCYGSNVPSLPASARCISTPQPLKSHPKLEFLKLGGLEAIKAQETGGRAALEDSMAALEGIADKTVGLRVSWKSHAEGGTVGVVSNPDEIDIGEDEDDDEFEQRDRDVDVEQASVPASVFTGEGVS